MKEDVFLDVGDTGYHILIGPRQLRSGQLAQWVGAQQAMIITTRSIAPHYLDLAKAALDGVGQVDALVLPDGEEVKTLDTINQIITVLLERGHKRSTTLVALGGGVVGDMTGFAAACFQRGVAFVQIPTTLLAQVDSSVGGKTGVNHPLGKNMIGAFHQPAGVLIDTDTLGSLPRRELSAGMAEVIKHGMLADADLFGWLEESMDALLRLEADALVYAIRRNVEIKAAVVAQDEKEAGLRAILNLGHTFGHAIETALGYGRWVHGEAVGAGLVMAADLSRRLGRIPVEDARRVKRLVDVAGLPTCPPESLSAEAMRDLMARDKKATADGLRFILLRELGHAEVVDDVPEDLLNETLQAGQALCG